MIEAISGTAAGRPAMDPAPEAAVLSPYLSPAGAAVALAAAVLLCWPMLLTSAPLIFFDTLSYYTNGEEIWSRAGGVLGSFIAGAGEGAPAQAGLGELPADAAATSFRSLPYSALFYPLAILPFGLVLVCVLQTAMTLWVFLGLVPPLTAEVRGFAIAAFAAVGMVTTLPWFASYAMPDLLGAVLPAYFALAPERVERMGWGKRIVLMAIATFAMLSHYGNLPLALALALGTVLWCIWKRRLTLRKLTYCLLPVIAAFGINLASSIVINAVTPPPAAAEGAATSASIAGPQTVGPAAAREEGAGADGSPPSQPANADPAATAEQPAGLDGASFTPSRIPVLLARSIEDGPGRWYLDEECAELARYAICELFDQMPDNAYFILWSDSGLRSATADQKARVRAEEMEIVVAAAGRYPLQQAAALLKNTFTQFVLVGTSRLLPIPDRDADRPLPEMRPRPADNDANPALQAFHWITQIATLVAFLVLLWRMATGRTQDWPTEAVFVTCFALLVNAAVFGGLSAPVDRYQSRMVWLIPALLALDLIVARANGRVPRLRTGEAPQG